MKGSEQVNLPQSELTYEKLKTYKGFENVSEEEATKQIGVIKRLAKIMYYMYMEEQKKNMNDKNSSDENRT